MAVQQAAPFGTPYPSIVSPDGKVYLQWDLRADPVEACSTRNARPFLLRPPLSLQSDVDKSHPVQLLARPWWNCPFPPEANIGKIDSAMVKLRLTVRPDGTAVDAEVLNDPPRGFGRAARTCSLAMRYVPALDRNGTPVWADGILWVHFSR